MRITTNLIYDRGLQGMTRQQSQVLDTQRHIASGLRVDTPSDDPVAASRAVEVAQAGAFNRQLATNQQNAAHALALAESTLGAVGDVLQSARELLIQGANDTLTDADRRSVAAELSAQLDALLGLANTRDASGRYLFSGFQETVQPFTRTATGALYNGDQGQRMLQVGPQRSLAVTENGVEIFERIPTGNGAFAVAADPANTGSGIIGPGSVVNAAAVNGDGYRIQFTVAAGVTTYAVLDTTTGTTLSTGNPYTPGASIAFGGMQVDVKGDPANGDAFDVAPSTRQSVFTTLADAVAALNAGTGGTTAGRTVLQQGIIEALGNIDQAMERALIVRTGTGARLREVAAVADVTSGLALEYDRRLSELQDLDYAKAISDLTRQQQALEAAQQSYQRITALSLFDYL